MTTTSTKRSYQRRSEDERIADLQAKIAEIEERKKLSELRTSPLMKDFERFKKHAAKFTQACVDLGRNDVANSLLAQMNTIERQVNTID